VVIFESKKKSENDLPVWISEQVNEKGYKISTKACLMLQEFLGNNLEKIANELGKLYINHPKNQQITEDIIEQYIGISKDYNINELQKALAFKDTLKAYQITYYFAANPKENPIFKTIPILLSFYTKTLHLLTLDKPHDSELQGLLKANYYMLQDCKAASKNYSISKIQDIISWLREANTKALGIDNNTVEHGELLKELIFKILH
jgi:DNA polymerase III subunit delta